MSRTRVLAVLAVWLVVVAGTSTLVWAVISQAGEDLTPSLQPPRVATATETPRPSGSPSSPVSSTRRTWQGPAGLIIATCVRDEIRLVSAQPASGFHAELKDDGPARLEVEFEAREDERGGDVKILARCASGIPQFTSQPDDD